LWWPSFGSAPPDPRLARDQPRLRPARSRRDIAHFADDAVFDAPRGPEACGRRIVGKAAIREAFAARFAGIPDFRYRDDRHFVDGDRGASEWRLTGTTIDGVRLDLRGCDLWTFREGKVVKKDSYWKIVTER
jgi:ketosteroid isomerase-like protein